MPSSPPMLTLPPERRRTRKRMSTRRPVDVARLVAGIAPRGGRAPQFGAAIVQRQHAVAPGLDPPQINHLPQLVRLLVRKIVAFREILVDVVKLPLVGFERHIRLVIGYGLPAIGPDAAMAEHLEILRLFRRRR